VPACSWAELLGIGEAPEETPVDVNFRWKYYGGSCNWPGPSTAANFVNSCYAPQPTLKQAALVGETLDSGLGVWDPTPP
jgi:hypothetical protein